MRMRLELQEKSLDNLFNKVSKLDEEDEIKTHLAKYLCIQASGYLENVIKELIAEFHNGSCHRYTEKFVTNKLRGFTNLRDDKLSNLLKEFSESWSIEFYNKITEKQKTSINSVVANRHLIAHGDANGSSIRFSQMVQYYNDLKEVANLIKSIIKK